MAVTANDITVAGPGGTSKWVVNAISTDWQGNEIVKADPGSGYELHLELIVISCVSAISLVLNCDTTAFLGPFYFAATSGSPVVLDFRDNPVIMTANTALQMDGSGAGAACIVVKGRTHKT